MAAHIVCCSTEPLYLTVRFKYVVCWFVLLLAAPLTLCSECKHYKNRGPGVYLSYECLELNSIREDGPPVIMMHGHTLLKETWHDIYQSIPKLAHRRVCIYDARNHGDSGWNDTFTADAMLEDLENFMRDREIERAALVAHGMCALSAMKLALKHPTRVESLFVEEANPLDNMTEIAPAIRVEMKAMLDSLSAIPPDADEETIERVVTDYIIKAINIPPVPHQFKKFPFCTHNGVWEWKLNLESFYNAFEDPLSFCGKIEGRYDGRVHFVSGELSDSKMMEDEEDIKKLFPNAEFSVINGVEYDIHAQKPAEFQSVLIKFLNQGAPQKKASNTV